jgi:hypothetical protein
MWRRVGLEKNDVLEERVASIFRIEKLRTTLRHIPEVGILHSHRCQNLKSNVCFIHLQTLSFQVKYSILK